MPDSILIEQLKAGDPQAVQYWFQHYQPRLLRFVQGKVAVMSDCEELVQETFINCLKHLPLFSGNSSIWTWMCSIAKHEIADYYRKKYAKRAVQTLPLVEALCRTSPLDAHQTAEKVAQVLSQMKTESQELLQLKYIVKKRVEEIALELGKSVKAVESDLFRARQEFKLLYSEFAH